MSRRGTWSPELEDYLKCILWAETDESDDSGGYPLDRNYGLDDFSDEAIAQAVKDLAEFRKRIDEAMLVMADAAMEEGELEAFSEDVDAIDWDRLGTDFWLSRVGHGTGFFAYPEKYTERFAEVFQEVARKMRERHAYVGDDGKIYVE